MCRIGFKDKGSVTFNAACIEGAVRDLASQARKYRQTGHVMGAPLSSY